MKIEEATMLNLEIEKPKEYFSLNIAIYQIHEIIMLLTKTVGAVLLIRAIDKTSLVLLVIYFFHNFVMCPDFLSPALMYLFSL